MPKVGERVLVEAAFNPNMPFKWNATRVQVLPNQVSQGWKKIPNFLASQSLFPVKKSHEVFFLLSARYDTIPKTMF